MHAAALTTATVTLTNGPPDTRAWPQTHDRDSESPLESWHLNDTPSNFQPARRPPSAGFIQNPSFQPQMTTLTDAPSDAPVSTNRWRMNTSGQLVDATAESAEWDLADEIVRLKIGQVAPDADDIPIRTPPKSKLVSAQLIETSPLDTVSIPSVNSSPLASDHIGASHSRGSSTDTTVSSSQDSVASNTMVVQPPVQGNSSNDVRERPHSFSGRLSSADLKRLQQVGDQPGAEAPQEIPFQQQWASIQMREGAGGGDKQQQQFAPEQPAYPSLAASPHGAAVHRPPGPLPQHQLYDYRTGVPQNGPIRDDLQIDYNIQQRNFNPLPQASNVAASPAFIPGRPNNVVPGMPYRQPPRGFPQQGLLPSPTALGYPGAPHAPHLSMANSQQLYEMMLPGHENHHPAVARVQQQHNVFRGTHHHSASDPSASLRDAATLALLNGNMQAFAGNMFPQAMAPPPTALSMYGGQFYQDAYARPDVVTAQAMARLQAQYTGPYASVLPGAEMGMTDGSMSPGSNNGQGPSANNRKLGLYKTELCRSWEEKGTCRYAGKCQFAHGEEELRVVSRHPKYKTEICRTFWVSGSCPYGKRCCFIHTELPPSGTGGEAAPPPPRSSDGRARSMSTNSDPNDASVSLLARIAKRDAVLAPTPTEATPSTGSGFQFTRPPTGSLRVDTSVDASASLKQNKSAYPTFTSKGVLINPPERFAAKSPAPLTAGPDLGRHSNSRLEIVGYNQRTAKAPTPSNANVRHSFNGSEGDVNFSSSPPASNHSPFTLPSNDNTPSAGRTNGHVRSGSAGNWGSFSRSSHLSAGYGQASPSTDAPANSPWSTTELAVGSSRLNEKAWA
ncbi:hypothetical protein GGX14DRAFT_641447 [Mycena pura]|uniref:C3H1-type domain-containing protein n=1 Tax=Mycena pura TaxID=153505 RepID=A0AAD6YPY2_9AGAR|nr:hypothetical protein GGX14DRAFT_641447 [Mycena pura]